MQYTISMGFEAQEGGGFKAVVQWQIEGREPTRKFSPEIYATEADAMGAAEYMAGLLMRLAENMGYKTETFHDVTSS